MIPNELMILTKSERRTRFWLQLPIIVILQNVAQLLYIGIYGVINGGNFAIDFTSKSFVIGALFSTGLTLVFITLYSSRVERRSLLSLGITQHRIYLDYIIGGLLGCTTIVLIFTIIIGLAKGQFQMQGNFNLSLAMLYLIGFSIQGISEEVIFRGYLLNGLSTRFSPKIAIVISSILFSVVHFANGNASILSFINLTTFGLVLGFLFYQYQNIWLVVGLHTAWNFISSIIYGSNVSNINLSTALFKIKFSDQYMLLSGGEFGFEGSIVTTIILIIFFLIYFWQATKKVMIIKK